MEESALRYKKASAGRYDVETMAANKAARPGDSAPGAFPNDGPSLTPAAAEAFAQQILARDYSLQVGRCVRRGWYLVMSDFWHTVGITALILVLMVASLYVEVVGIGVAGTLMGGLFLYFLRKIRGEEASLATAFSGFKIAFLQLFLASLVAVFLPLLAGIVVVVFLDLLGLVCLILPGICLATLWLFTLPLVIDKRLDFGLAMGLSRKTVSKHWWQLLGFAVVLMLINLAGILAIGIGFFITAPVALAAIMYAYEDIYQQASAVKTPLETIATTPPPPGYPGPHP